MFKALVLNKAGRRVTAAVEQVDEARLPEGDVTVAVEHSTLNYKDGLIIQNKAPLVRSYPHVPGIDFAGRVVESAHPDWRPGDAVILTGWGVGERHWGGYAAARPGQGRLAGAAARGLDAPTTPWRSAPRASPRCSRCMALEHHGLEAGRRRGPGHRRRGRGRLGRDRAPGQARPSGHRLDRPARRATTICARSAPAPSSTGPSSPSRAARPLESERFAGCIDAVGGTTLARVLGQMKYRCSVAAVGLAGGSELATTVIPFLLRGVNLLGIDSVYQPRRRAAPPGSASRATSISPSWKA